MTLRDMRHRSEFFAVVLSRLDSEVCAQSSIRNCTSDEDLPVVQDLEGNFKVVLLDLTAGLSRENSNNNQAAPASYELKIMQVQPKAKIEVQLRLNPTKLWVCGVVTTSVQMHCW